MQTGVRFITEASIGRVTLDRAEALNALSLPMINAMYQQLILWEQDPAICAVCIEAVPGRAFCAGGDVRWLYEAGIEKNPAQLDFFSHEYRLNALIGAFKKPILSLMNGYTFGGGVGIGLHSTYPIATEQFIMAMPETAIGLFPDVGASYLLSRLPAGLGMYLALTGRRLTAAEALSYGLVKYVIPAASLNLLLASLLELNSSDDFLPAIDSRLKQYCLPGTSAPIFADLNRITPYFTADSLEQIFAALRQSQDPWAAETLALLLQMSPMSLKVTFMQLQKARHLSLNECLAMDAVLVKHFMQGHDFYEGVRAALIDKDKMPRWLPASIEDITDEQVGAYFVA